MNSTKMLPPSFFLLFLYHIKAFDMVQTIFIIFIIISSSSVRVAEGTDEVESATTINNHVHYIDGVGCCNR
jgi:hypothetical protein